MISSARSLILKKKNLKAKGGQNENLRTFLIPFPFLGLGGAFAPNNGLASDKVTAAMRTVTVTEKDNNSKVELNKGDTLAVILDFSPGTGYSWQIAKNDVNVLEPEGEPVISGGTEQKNMPGGGEQATFRFKALNSGTTVIALHHKRPWEKEKEPLKVISITVNIK